MNEPIVIDGIKIINNMSFKEFKEGIKYDNTLQMYFEPSFNNKKLFLQGTSKIINYIFLFFTYTVPYILIPVSAYHYGNWYLLIGFICLLGSIQLASERSISQIVLPALLLTYYWYHHGFHPSEWPTFYWICSAYGGTLEYFRVGLEEEYSKISILKDEELFNKLSEENIIYFMSKVK
jgi:hypothetical protein